MGVLTAIFNTLIIVASVFLVCLILIQRGKGGGLAGAFGGVGGSSAFGTKAGDTFTRITVVTAAAWILMAMILVVLTNRRTSVTFEPAAAAASRDAGSKSSKAADTAPAAAPGAASPATTPAEAPADGPAPAIPDDAKFPATPGDSGASPEKAAPK
ncbi:preprotein translocase subunit SecG [Aquisphaera giovannonii]|uniref:Protein-export membrane protein SecG n=1 Tax=Aquisphaera giovannonii TaxID=406548 RepID=A0A5B9WE77_9BACT|nr:preprotein translocase subunit SecG [Aquisphaera giovannonii]QEH38365.1 preprotein translocase subunit SecG [Aquisphaera giovannonii]